MANKNLYGAPWTLEVLSAAKDKYPLSEIGGYIKHGKGSKNLHFPQSGDDAEFYKKITDGTEMAIPMNTVSGMEGD